MIKGIKGIPPLTEEEEANCIKEYQKTGSQEALNKLVLSNQGFIFNVAMSIYKKMYKNIGGENSLIEFGDLISTGNLGLLRAIQSFDPEKGTRLLTYAGHWISAFIELYVKKEINKHSQVSTLDESRDVSDNTWDEHDQSSLEHNLNKELMLSYACKDLTDDEKLYVYAAVGSLPVDLSKEDLANIMLKPSTRSLDCRKSIREKISKKKLKNDGKPTNNRNNSKRSGRGSS